APEPHLEPADAARAADHRSKPQHRGRPCRPARLPEREGDRCALWHPREVPPPAGKPGCRARQAGAAPRERPPYPGVWLRVLQEPLDLPAGPESAAIEFVRGRPAVEGGGCGRVL